MKPSDVVHKTVFTAGAAPKPSAKASHGKHQKRHPLGPLHSKSRRGPDELDASLTMFESPNEKENGARGKRSDMDGKPEGCFRGKKTS